MRGIPPRHTGYEQNVETSTLVSLSPIKWWRCRWHPTMLLWGLKIKQSKCLVESWHSYYLLNVYIVMPFLSFFFFFWPYCVVCGILVPWPGIEPGPLAMKVLTPNHWITREVLSHFFIHANCPQNSSTTWIHGLAKQTKTTLKQTRDDLPVSSRVEYWYKKYKLTK